jgi:hypothetical protein
MRKAPAPTTASTVIGYARVSTVGQTLEQQTEALTGHTDIVSSVALSPNGMNAWRSVPKSRDKSTPST